MPLSPTDYTDGMQKHVSSLLDIIGPVGSSLQVPLPSFHLLMRRQEFVIKLNVHDQAVP